MTLVIGFTVGLTVGVIWATCVWRQVIRRLNRKWTELVEKQIRLIDQWQRLHEGRPQEIETVEGFIDDVLGHRRSRQ